MKYAAKKFLSTVATLLVVSVLVFVAFDLIPGDAALAQLGTNATPERVEALREEMGLNEPLPVRYIKWAGAFVKGDFGTSYSYNIPVSDIVTEKLPISICMTLMAFVIVLAVSFPLGIIAAKHENKKLDTFVSTVNQIIMSIPPFFSGLIITIIFGLILKWFVPGGFISFDKSFWGCVGYLFFPALAIALPKSAMATKMLRSSIVSELEKDYTKVAYSRGNSTNQVLIKHVLKNAVIPVLTFFGMAIADIFTGSIIIEKVFNIPGLGRILLNSISNRDYPVVQAIIMLMTLLVVLTNFFVDLLYHKLDPQIVVET